MDFAEATVAEGPMSCEFLFLSLFKSLICFYFSANVLEPLLLFYNLINNNATVVNEL